MESVFKAAVQELDDSNPMVVATVVRTSGSTPQNRAPSFSSGRTAAALERLVVVASRETSGSRRKSFSSAAATRSCATTSSTKTWRHKMVSSVAGQCIS